jgi:hypothetical protein
VTLPPYANLETIRERLQVIFPEGVPQRNYCVREAAAATVFTMLYIGAIQGTEIWVAPKQIVRMTSRQAARSDESARRRYAAESLKPRFQPKGKTWYQENSREQIRDETIRQGFIPNNAVVERVGLATTSSRPRYALLADFAILFDPALNQTTFEKTAAAWQEKYLSATALARTLLVRRGAVTTGEGVLVTFPNGETRRMAPGPSSVISKAVIEVFASRFLAKPAVLWVSESGAKTIARDDDLARNLNLKITPDRNLPDIILVDLGSSGSEDFLLVFVEVVATDGPITADRREALLGIATEAGFPTDRVAFVTAYVDRANAAFKKTIPELAWRSFAWFAAEPEHIIALHDGTRLPPLLRELLRKA